MIWPWYEKLYCNSMDLKEIMWEIIIPIIDHKNAIWIDCIAIDRLMVKGKSEEMAQGS